MAKESKADHLGRIIDAVEKVAKGDYSVRIERPDESDELGPLAGVINTMIDHAQKQITDGRQAYERLKESEQRFREMFDDAPVGYHELDAEGRFTHINKTELEIFGYPTGEMIGRYGWEFVADKETSKQRVLAKLAGTLHPSQGAERLYQRKDGTKFSVLIEDRLLRDAQGKITGIRTIIQDITERKRVEAALKESEERFKEMFNDAPVGYHELDAEGRFTWINRTELAMLGYTADEVIGHYAWEIVADREKSKQRVLGKLAGTIPPNRNQEQFWNQKNGTAIPVLSEDRILHDAQGRITGIRTIVQDITNLKQANQALKESEARFKEMFDDAPVGYHELDAQGRYLRVNKTELAMLGYTAEEIIGHYVWEFVADQEESKKRVYGKLIGTVPPSRNIEHLLKRKNGTTIPVLTEDRLLRNAQGRITGIRTVLQNITSLKRAEEALRESEAQFRKMLETVPTVAVQGYRSDGTIFYWNKANEAVYGYTKEEAIGRNFLELIIPPELREDMRRVIQRGGVTGEMPEASELLLMRKDGSRVPVFMSHAVLHVPGREAELYCIDIDLTKLKQAEEIKDKLEAQLLQSQKMESVGRLAGGVAHDFNNMLSVILGYTELIESALPEGDPLMKDVLEIERAATRSKEITRQLLGFSRKQIIAPKPLNLNDLIASTYKTLIRLIGEDVELRLFPGQNLWSIKFDPAQADQILLNLAVNARDALPKGGQLTVETSNVQLDDDYCRQHLDLKPGDYVLLQVSDNGVGMDKETQSHLFEPFFTTKDIGKGTGLGLATVYGIVKQNNALINVYSEPGKGSTFKIYIPRLLEGEQPAEKVEEQLYASGHGTILLVEDDEMMRRMTKAMLEAIGYTVVVPETAQDALAHCKQEDRPIDLLLTDVVMPFMNGTELRDRIEAIKPGTKVLFMSGYTSNVIVHVGVLQEGVNFIQKPFNMKDLARKIREALQNR